jgi:tryptophanyl-tRNA synthetase
MRPSGKLHIGHYHGTLQNWISLQDKYECFYFVADWHALTTRYDDVKTLQSDIENMVIDWLAAGLDPEKCFIYRQSKIPEIAELNLYMSMITPISWLERCPTYKEQLQELNSKDISTHGFLGYPILQTADIAICHGEFVPIGEDQLPHLELGREVIRRFNYLYNNLFPEPQPLLAPVKRLLGTDGRKMSKSYNNAINLSDSPEQIRTTVKTMITDPERIKLTDPGHPEICLVFGLHKIYSENALDDIETKCKNAIRGCTDCKDLLSHNINESLVEFRERRKQFENNPELVDKVLEDSALKVRQIAKDVLVEVKKHINIG